MIQHPRVLKNNIDHLRPQGPPAFFYLDTNPVRRDLLLDSAEKNHALVVTVELIWLLFLNILFSNFIQTPNKSFRFKKFRRSYAHRSVVVKTNHCRIWTASFAWRALFKVATFLFLRLIVPNDLHRVNYFCWEHFCWAYLLLKFCYLQGEKADGKMLNNYW